MLFSSPTTDLFHCLLRRKKRIAEKEREIERRYNIREKIAKRKKEKRDGCRREDKKKEWKKIRIKN